jgi:mannitol/fructose-specific phosphotransferase system IIA component (Ntr-type)
MQTVLSNLRQCDEWLRQRHSSLKREDLVAGLLSYALTIAPLQHQANNPTHSADICRLLSDQAIIVYLPSSVLSKEEILHQLVAIVSTRYHSLNDDVVLDSIWRRESVEPVILRQGLALPHAAVENGPRIAMSMAIVPKGVTWDPTKPDVQVIILFLYAHDTQRTYLDHMAQLAAMFKRDERLQKSLVCARNAREVLAIMRRAEESLI